MEVGKGVVDNIIIKDIYIKPTDTKQEDFIETEYGVFYTIKNPNTGEIFKTAQEVYEDYLIEKDKQQEQQKTPEEKIQECRESISLLEETNDNLNTMNSMLLFQIASLTTEKNDQQAKLAQVDKVNSLMLLEMANIIIETKEEVNK